jgi:hypothetical protein
MLRDDVVFRLYIFALGVLPVVLTAILLFAW